MLTNFLLDLSLFYSLNQRAVLWKVVPLHGAGPDPRPPCATGFSRHELQSHGASRRRVMLKPKLPMAR